MNEITMKMQADQLIRMALQEDITSEDVSTNAVMPTATKGTVDLIAKKMEWLPDWKSTREYLRSLMKRQKLIFIARTEMK